MMLGKLLFLGFFVVCFAQNPMECINPDDFNPSFDYFPDKFVDILDDLFTIEYSLSYKTVTNIQTNEKFVLYQCGTPVPKVEATSIFSIPINTTVLMDTTSITFLELLGVRDKIKMVAYPEFVGSACLQAQLKEMPKLNSSNVAQATNQMESFDVVFEYLDPTASLAQNSVSFPATADTGVFKVIFPNERVLIEALKMDLLFSSLFQ